MSGESDMARPMSVDASVTRAAMADAIWKFELRPWSIFIDIPQGAKILAAGAQGIDVVIWALCDTEALKVSRLVAAVPTGVMLPRAYDGAKFVGTVQMDDGLVFHVFDGGEQ